MSKGEITPEQMAVYRATARRRHEQWQQAMARRRERAWDVARRGAALLKQQFGAQPVVLFGSLARDGVFDERSDIDLAAWGIEEKDYLRAVGRLLDLDAEIEIDLVMGEEAQPSLLESIWREGLPL